MLKRRLETYICWFTLHQRCKKQPLTNRRRKSSNILRPQSCKVICARVWKAYHCNRPLLGIFSNQELNSINNSQICTLKEKTLSYSFTIQHNPGKWNQGGNAFSRNPSNNDHIHSIFSINTKQNDQESITDENTISSLNHTNANNFLTLDNKSSSKVNIDNIQNAFQFDTKYQTLLSIIKNWFKNADSSRHQKFLGSKKSTFIIRWYSMAR